MDKKYRNAADDQVSKKLKQRALLSIGLFFVTLISCCLIFGFFEYVSGQNFEDFSWGNISGLTSLVTMALLFGGLLFAYYEQEQKAKEEKRKDIEQKQKEEVERREKNKLSYEQYKNIHVRLTSPEQEEARRWIYINIPIKAEDQPLEEWLDVVTKAINKKPKGWTEPRTPGQTYLKMVLNDFDYIGFIYKNFWDIQPDLEEAYIGWLSPPVAKVWERIGPYVEAQREERNEPDYYEAAEAIGEYAIRWRKENGFTESEIIKDTV